MLASILKHLNSIKQSNPDDYPANDTLFGEIVPLFSVDTAFKPGKLLEVATQLVTILPSESFTGVHLKFFREIHLVSRQFSFEIQLF